MNRADAAKLIAVCRAMYPTHPIPDPDGIVTGWAMALDGWPYAAIEPALRTHLKTSKWFPAPAELVDLAASASGFLPNETDAWRLVQDHIHGPQRPFAGPKPVEEAVKAIGGFYALRTSQQPAADRKAFAAAYADVRKRWLGDPKLGGVVAERMGVLGDGGRAPTEGAIPAASNGHGGAVSLPAGVWGGE